MSIRARGQYRFGDGVKPNDLAIMRKNGEWFASLTLARRRHHAKAAKDKL
jgi:putative transposase